MPYRVGVQTAEPLCASVKAIPAAAIRSKFGVAIFPSRFKHLRSPKPRSSHRTYTMLGFSAAIAPPPTNIITSSSAERAIEIPRRVLALGDNVADRPTELPFQPFASGDREAARIKAKLM